MSCLLHIEPALFENLMAHLLPPDSEQEQAAFLFVRRTGTPGSTRFDIVESAMLDRRHFAWQEGYYLELDDGARAGLIKRAHDLEASLVEIHSHLGDYPAAFSLSDRTGLKDTVPHMWWRLKGRPYIAIVVATSGFDALVWLENSKIPGALDGIRVADRTLKPTNHSLKGWS